MELQDDVEEESDAAPQSTQPRRQNPKVGKSTATDKGKGKASYARGPLPAAAQEEAQEFGHQVMDAADQLADKWNTTRRSILVAASLWLRETRGPNSANKHSAWYASHYPQEPGGQYASILSFSSLLITAYSITQSVSTYHSGGLQATNIWENGRRKG